MTSKPPSTRAIETMRTRAKIILAARTIFYEKGWADTTVSDIAKAAETTSQTCYNQFGSKHAILGYALMEGTAMLGGLVAATLNKDRPSIQLLMTLSFYRAHFEAYDLLYRSLYAAWSEEAARHAGPVTNNNDVRRIVQLEKPLAGVLERLSRYSKKHFDVDRIAIYHAKAMLDDYVEDRNRDYLQDWAEFHFDQIAPQFGVQIGSERLITEPLSLKEFFGGPQMEFKMDWLNYPASLRARFEQEDTNGSIADFAKDFGTKHVPLSSSERFWLNVRVLKHVRETGWR